MHTRLPDVLRSLAFYLIFYTGSVGFVLAALLALLIAPSQFLRASRAWSAWHAVCVRALLGIRVQIEGDLPKAPVLIAFKHESFFELLLVFAYPF